MRLKECCDTYVNLVKLNPHTSQVKRIVSYRIAEKIPQKIINFN